ncbi:RNA 2',3'-cyclic phosphodiesterase [Heliobacterium undosum]|uniref:RNA 2',3'-cyclic phosphodiesterase n=1 Tax=Heliomicrobium undosum TaxID=121734 RepID=A0A845L213_9FIRM|nr:RNA 2',3'-cyclic phosphodiesterase [Heliomicrobium undosum]MZP28520.1 RNA 2',3'-cyclic phosphodiesterase [Heliomicrobium undosum]
MRAFFAVDLAEPVRQACREAQSALLQAGVKANWVKPLLMHITIKFLGDVAPSLAKVLADDAAGRLAGFKPFPIGFGGFGAFPRWNAPRVLWLGVKDPDGQLGQLQTLVQQNTESRLTSRGPQYSTYREILFD